MIYPGSMDHLKDGDCIVFFNTNDIFSFVNKLRSCKKKAAIIYGGLPPGWI